VLINLLSNAIKYNRSGGLVTVRCTQSAEQRVRVSIEDTGAGLSASQLAQLFQPFNRLGKEYGSEPGTGIGLVICKRLVEQMGGVIGADSTTGVGSCFWFELDAAPPPVADRVVPKHTVLYIENDAGRLPHIEKSLERLPSACVLRASDIQAGIRMARSARPHVIVIGVRASDPDGVRAMQMLARDPSTTHIPVIAVCAQAVPCHDEPGLSAGYFRFLTQPLQSDALSDALERAFQRNQAIGHSATATETPRC
jgi:CheY-like chemotaxis protein